MPPYQKDLPAFGDRYLQIFDPVTKSTRLRSKSQSNGCLSIPDIMQLSAALLQRYESTYWTHRLDPTLIQLPFLFSQPEVGDQIRNVSTGEIYTIAQVLLDEKGRWAGHLKLDLVNPPSYEERHSLQFLNPDRYIRFVHAFTPSPSNNPTANNTGNFSSAPPMRPTVSWSLLRKEPGSLHGSPFSAGKEFKPRLRDTVKDPTVKGYTVEIYGQWFDNLVQFNCWSNDTATSSNLTDWVEGFFRNYAGFLRENGVSQMFFWQRTRDETSASWRQALAVQNTVFYFRTEELEAYYHRDLLKIDIAVGLADSFRDLEPRYIAGQLTSGELTQQQYLDLFYRSGQYLFGEIDILQ